MTCTSALRKLSNYSDQIAMAGCGLEVCCLAIGAAENLAQQSAKIAIAVNLLGFFLAFSTFGRQNQLSRDLSWAKAIGGSVAVFAIGIITFINLHFLLVGKMDRPAALGIGAVQVFAILPAFMKLIWFYHNIDVREDESLIYSKPPEIIVDRSQSLLPSTYQSLIPPRDEGSGL